MKKTIVSLFCVLALCLGLLPTTALAAGEGAPDTLWVGETQITASGYWITDANGKLSAGNENNYNVYYDGNGTLTLKDATIQGRGNSNNSEPQDYGIYAAPTGNQSVSLTIKLIGSNTVKGDSGIYVGASGGDSTLVIQSDGNDPKGSLEANGSGWNGITISSDSGNASLTINNASVVANSEKQGSHGVSIMSRSSTELSLTVNGGSLTAKGTYGIFYSSFSGTNPSTSLTVSDSALIKAIPNISASVASKPTPQGDGIVFDGTEGTVYGDVTLDESLTIAQGETLTIPQGTTLNGNNLTNNGTVTIENGGTLTGGDAINNTGTINVENGGKLDGTPTGTVITTPAITTQPESKTVTVGQPATFTVAASGGNLTYQWQQKTTDSGATWTDISGANKPTYTTEATALNMNGYQYQCVVSNTAGSVASAAATLTVQSIPVASVTLNKNTLSLVVDGTETLTATVEPKNATDQTLTWSSDKPEIAKVENGVVTAVASGTATITATANGGSGISATCEVTVEPKTYTIQVAPAELTFGAVQVGYTQPAAQTVTITNTGNQQVTVKLPIATNFDIAAGKGFENGSATIEPNGTATFTVQPKAGLAVGEYKEELTVSNQNAGEVTLTLTFKVNPVLVSGLTLNQNTLALFAGDSATLTAAVTPENATNKTLTWASSNTAVATVDQSGKVTAVAPGTAAITVTTNDGSGKVASCPVTVTAKTYALTIDPAAIGFGTVQPGYTQPAAREITVKNTGNQTLTLTQPTATKYLVGSLSRLTLAPGETATFTVQPKADQPVAVYNETILVVGNGGAGASLNLSFTVEKASGTSSGTASSSSSAITTTEKRTLHFDTNGGLPLDDVVRGLGAPVELWPYTPVRAGYLFQGWYADQALTRAVSSVVLTKDTTIYAKWAVDPAATAAPSGSGSGSGSSGSSGKGSGSQGGTTITVTPAPTASPTPTPEPTATPTPEPTATPEASAEPETDTDTASFPVVPVAAGVIVLVVLVGGITIYRRFHD